MTTADRSDGELPPMAKHLGFSRMQLEPGRILLSGRCDEVHDRNPSLIHSLAAATIDAAFDRVFRSALAAGESPAIVELKMRFARAFTSANGTLTCRVTMLDLNEHLGTAVAEIVDETGARFVDADATCVIRREGSTHSGSNA